MKSQNSDAEMVGAMDRRKFLALGGAGLVTTAIVGAGGVESAHSAKLAKPARTNLIGPTLEAGYVLGSAADDGCACKGPSPIPAGFIPLSELPEGAPFKSNMVSATRIGGGEPSLTTRGAKVRVCGVFPDESALRQSFVKGLTLSFNSFHAQGATFHAWGFSPWSVSPGVTFAWPVDPIAGISMNFQFSDIYGNQGQTGRDLVPGGAIGANKLRPGIYVFALRQAGASKPISWGKYQLRAPDSENQGAKRYLYQADPRNRRIVLADFPYVVIRVDPA